MNHLIVLLLIPAAAAFLLPLVGLRRRHGDPIPDFSKHGDPTPDSFEYGAPGPDSLERDATQPGPQENASHTAPKPDVLKPVPHDLAPHASPNTGTQQTPRRGALKPAPHTVAPQPAIEEPASRGDASHTASKDIDPQPGPTLGSRSAVVPGPGFSAPLLIVLLAFAAGAIYGMSMLSSLFIDPVSVITANWLPPFGINLFFSPLTVGAAIMIYVIAFFVTVFDIRHTEKRESSYYLLYALMVFSSIGMILTADLFNLFVFLEIGGIASFACVGTGNRFLGSKGAIVYLIQAQLLSLLMLAGIAFVYSATGVLNMAWLAGGAALNPAFGFLAAVLILLPILLEVKLFPFNSWVPQSYHGASASFAGSISGIMALAGGLAMMRLYLTVMNPSGAFRLTSEKLSILLIVLGGVTVLFGELSALKEKELKKVLGFSSIGQMGMITVGIGVANIHSIEGALFLIASHSAAKLLLFLVTGFFIRASGSGEWEKMVGIGRRFPLAAGFFVIGALTLMGMPLFSGFWGKLSLLRGVLDTGGPALFGFVAILVGTVIEGVYFMRIGHGFFTSEEGRETGMRPTDRGIETATKTGGIRTDTNAERTAEDKPGQTGRRYTASFLIPAVILSLAVIIVGIYPTLIKPWIAAGSQELSDPDYYREGILPEGGEW